MRQQLTPISYHDKSISRGQTPIERELFEPDEIQTNIDRETPRFARAFRKFLSVYAVYSAVKKIPATPSPKIVSRDFRFSFDSLFSVANVTS